MFQCTSNYWSVLLHEFLCVVGTMFMNFNISLEERMDITIQKTKEKGKLSHEIHYLRWSSEKLDFVLSGYSNDVFCCSFTKRTILFLLCMYLSIFKILNQPAWSKDSLQYKKWNLNIGFTSDCKVNLSLNSTRRQMGI